MAATEERILELIAGEEPDYTAAAAEVGADGLVILTAMVQAADASLAARAASLVAAIAEDPAVAGMAVPALALAAAHDAAGVRAVAAFSVSRIGDVAESVLADLLADADSGVRRMALSGLQTPLPPVIAARVEGLAAGNAAAGVAEQAAALVARQPGGLALGESLLAAALGYAHRRLVEFRDVALLDVPAFAAAAGVAIPDADGAIAALLTAARDALDLAAQALTDANLSAAARQVGLTLGALARASALAGGTPLADMLKARIGWGAVEGKGLASQLGLPTTAPALELTPGALEYRLTAPGKSLLPPPLALGFDRADVTARLRLDGEPPAFSVTLGLTALEAGVGSGDISKLLGSIGGSVQADVAFGVDTTKGLTLGGGSSGRVVLPARPKAGPLNVREISLEVRHGHGDTIDVGTTIAAEIGGVIQATVQGTGLHVRIDPAAALDGDNPISVEPKAPTGIGLVLDAGIVRGGGFLGERSGGFGGALQLRLGPVEVKAVGLLTLKPSFALVVVMSIEFLPPIDLSFGFTLNAVGGIVGIEHRLDTDALRAGIASGALDHIMFPADPVAAAPAILDTLQQVFPVDPGSVVIGPMVEIGWGRPVSFVSAQVGVILSLPDPKIVIIGRVRIALPAPELPIVDLRATVYGEITPDHLLILVSLNGSRIAGFTIGGDIGLLLRWGGSAEFAISAGGFHPRYDPPKELAGMRRLAMDLSPPAILTLRSESYFALTSNSVQLGSRVEMGADLVVASISGHFAFDALIVFSPRFMFMIDLDMGITVRVFGVTLCGVSVQLHVEGPGPWRAEGHAQVEILWSTIDVDVGPFTWGDEDNPPPEPADPRFIVHGALDRNPGSWQAIVPPEADRVVRLRAAAPSDTEVTVHPMGLFEVRQHAIPLETVMVRVGPNPVPDGQRRVHLGVPRVGGMLATTVNSVSDLFSAGNFLDLKEDEKLSRPGFEPMPAGARIGTTGELVRFDEARETELRYETFVCDPDGVRGRHTKAARDRMFATSATAVLAAGAAGRSELRAVQRYETPRDPIVLADTGEVLAVSKITLSAAAGAVTKTYTHAAEEPVGADQQLVRLGVA